MGETMNLRVVFLVVAVVLFVLAALEIGGGRLVAAGLSFLAASFLV
jgi:hypothetical protein